MKYLTKARWLLWCFAKFKVPMIGYTGARLVSIDDDKVVVKIKLKRRTKNHFNSMYFGALSVGADVAGGLFAVYHAQQIKTQVAPIFKSFEAQFHLRAESDVWFVCEQGLLVRNAIEQTKASGERVNQPVRVEAYTQTSKGKEHVASFVLGLSVKAKKT